MRKGERHNTKTRNTKAQDNVFALTPMAPARVGKKFSLGLKGDDITPLDRLQMWQWVSRKWRRHLSVNEFAVVTYIMDRSIGWGFETFRASHRNILDGNEEYSGIGLKKTVYMEALAKLEKMGAIHRKRSRDFVVLGLNFGWKPEEAKNRPIPSHQLDQKSEIRSSRSPETGGSEVRYPDTEERNYGKKEITLAGSPSAPGHSTNSDFDFGEEDPNTSPGSEREEQDFTAEKFSDENEEGGCNPVQLGQPATDEIRTQMEAAQQGHRKGRAARIAAAKAKEIPNSTDFSVIWNEAMREAHPDMPTPSWTKATRDKINRAIERYGTGGDLSFLDLTDWAVRNWTPIIRRQFKNMKNPPRTPSLNWFLAEGITMAFADYHATGKLKELASDIHQTTFDQLIARGMTEKDALAEIGRRDALSAMKDENAKAKADAAQKLRIAKDKEERAERLEGLGDTIEKAKELGVPVRKVEPRRPGQAWRAPAIPHPQSETMKRFRRERAEAEHEKNSPATPVNPVHAPPTETWEELQERLRRERAAKMNNNKEASQDA